MGVVDNGRGKRGGDAVRVLLVDDETTFRETLAKVLQRRGFFVGVAASGEEGLGILRAEDFDVVVLDLKMPGIGGMAALREIPKVRPTAKVIMLTGHGSAAAGIEAMSENAVDFLLKPVSVEEIVSVITTAAQARRQPGG